jgi:hypothetical protein
MFCNTKTMTVEDLVGRLRAAEERLDDKVEQIVDKAGRLMLAEEDWLEKHKHRFNQGPKDGGGGSHGGGSSGRGGHGGHYKAKAPARSDGGSPGAVKLTSEGTPRRKGRCRNCNIYWHWEQDCKRPKKEKKKDAKPPEANVAVGDAEAGALMLAACGVDVVRGPAHAVHLTEKVVPVVVPDGVWVLDTGASNHMTGNKSALTQLNEGMRGTVRFGDGSRVEIEGIGSMVMQDRHNAHKVLTEVYYIPKLRSNIVSLGQLEEKGFEVTLGKGKMCVFDPSGTLLISTPRTANRLYLAKFQLSPPICLLAHSEDLSCQWHARFGHLNFRALNDLSAKEMVVGMPVVGRVEKICDGCVLGKQHRLPFPHVSKFRASKGLELVHADLCGQITPKSLGGASYFLLVVDDYSRFMWVELLKSKDQALEYFKKMKTRAEVELDGKLKALRTDRGGEFTSSLFTIFCNDQGIKHYTTAPYSPQQNGVVERRNQTVVEMARCMMKAMQVPSEFWGEAICTAVYVLNRAPTKALNNKTPFESWFGRKPNVSHLRIFGCTASVKLTGPSLSKLSDRSRKMVFIGYEAGTNIGSMIPPLPS